MKYLLFTLEGDEFLLQVPAVISPPSYKGD